jgi:hypothetical protein
MVTIDTQIDMKDAFLRLHTGAYKEKILNQLFETGMVPACPGRRRQTIGVQVNWRIQWQTVILRA